MPTIRNFCRILILGACSLAPLPGFATGLVTEGNEARAVIELPGGLGADLIIRFDSVIGLGAESLGLSVETISPASPALLSRLPPSGLSIPAEFPVLVTIAAPPDGGLAFEGVVELELYTRNLHYVPGSNLRLFSSSNGETFRDITDEISGGSYRVRGSSGQFSEFLIVADPRPVSAIVDAKLGRIGTLLSTHSGVLGPLLSAKLNLLFAAVRSAWQLGKPGMAIEQLRLLEAAIRAAAHAGLLPSVWQSSGNVANVAGLLEAEIRTLRFTLGLALSAP